MRKNKILSVIGGLAAFIFTSCDGIFDVDYYTFLPEDYIFTNESTIEEGLLGCYELLYPNSFGGSSWGVRPHMMLANLPTLDVQASGWVDCFREPVSLFMEVLVCCYQSYK